MKIKSKLNKKAITIMTALIGIIITLLAFFVMMGVFFSGLDSYSTKTQDLACRATVEAKSNIAIKVGDEIAKRTNIDSFLNMLNNKCVVERLNIESSEKDEIFTKVADSLSRCWYRYGEGDKDFLGSFGTTGNWCFLCGTVDFKKGDKRYEFNKFIEWLEKTDMKERDENNKKRKYIDYLELKYSEMTPEESAELKIQYDDLMSDGDPSVKEIGGLILQKYEDLQDLQLKGIDTNQDLYLVLKYERMDESFSDQMTNAAISAGAGMAGAIVIGGLIEGAVMGAVSTASCVLAGATAVTVVGGAVFGTGCVVGWGKTIQTFSSAISKGAVSTAKLLKINKLMVSIEKKIKYTKKGKMVAELDNIVKIGNKKDIVNFIDTIKDKEEYAPIVKSLEESLEIMNKNKIDEFSDMGKVLQGKEDEILKMQGNLNNVIVEGRNFLRSNIKKSEKEYELQFKELARLEEKIKKLDLNIKEDATKFGDYARGIFTVIGGIAGGALGLDYSSKFNSYVDVMTKEQYNRLCGTERRISERLKK
jgi:hypothetical protein